MYISSWVIVIIIIVGYYIYSRSKGNGHGGNKDRETFSNYEIKEEDVFKTQTRFEKKLEDTFVPDAITYKDLYIFKNLMRGWYSKLSGENRYNNEIIQKLRTDWLDYMEALEDRNTFNFLYLETEIEKLQEEYWNKHIIASRKAFAIEDGFASSVGEKATKKLAQIRNMDSFVFDIEGNIKNEKQTKS